MIVKGYFSSLSEIIAAPILIVLNIDIPTQMECSFISIKLNIAQITRFSDFVHRAVL
jgi:hypothetical protein